MKGVCFLLLLMAAAVGAEKVIPLPRMNFSDCFGMYSKDSIPGVKQEAYIKIIAEDLKKESLFSYVIFNYLDTDKIGHLEEGGNRTFICSSALFEAKKCGSSNVNEFIVKDGGEGGETTAKISTGSNDASDFNDISEEYLVEKKGYYCVIFTPLTAFDQGTAQIQIINPYGDLPADIYPYLLFYGFVGLAYLVFAIIWGILSAIHFRELLQVQNYIAGIIILCMVETTFQYAYYADYNHTGTMSNALLSIAVLLNAARNSASFVALLVVCMGYGLVKPTLGTTAQKIIGLGFAHFVFGTLFAASSMLQTMATQKMMALLFVFPLAVTLTLFYSWTLNSLSVTMKKLEIRRQNAKIAVYVWLWRILVISIVALFVFVILMILQTWDDEYKRRNWDSFWFTSEGWIHLLYFFVFISIAFLWRPTKNNSRYTLVEFSQDGDDDAIGSGSGTGRIKMRNVRKNTRDSDDEEDALRWVEENISDDDEDPDPLTLDEEDEEKIARRERSKMN